MSHRNRDVRSTIPEVDVDRWVKDVEDCLRAEGTAERAKMEKRYLKSELEHYGVRVPAVRAVVKRELRREAVDDHDELVARAAALWRPAVHEMRLAAAELLAAGVDVLDPGDAALVERLVRESRTWALVDVLAPRVMGPMVERFAELGTVLDRWAADDDFWVRRAALLALLIPLRRGDGDFRRFTRYADEMLDDREFFVRKAIGWVLRDTGKKRPELVFDWVLPRADRLSAVTLREAVKPLSGEQRAAIEGARSGQRGRQDAGA